MAGVRWLSVGMKQTKGNMRIQFEVNEESTNSYDSKNKGHVVEAILTLTDKSKEGQRLTHTVEYVMTPEEKALHAGKLRDKQIILDVKTFKPWNGQIRAVGGIFKLV